MRLGERPIVSFRRGVDRSVPDSASPADAAQLIVNGWVNDDGSIERVYSPCFPPVNQTSSGTPYLGAAAVSFDGDEHWIRFRDTSINWTKASEGHGTFHNTAYSGTAESDQFFSWVTFRQANTDYVIFANGDDVQSFDGTTVATVSNAPTGAKYLATFHDRVWAAGHDGSALAASKIADFTEWASPDGLVLPVQTHNSEDIVGIYPLGGILLVFKPNSVGYVDGFGNSDVIVAAGGSGVTQSTGCVSFRTIIPVGDGLAWLSRRGIEYVQPGGPIQLVSEPINDVIQNLAWPVIEANPGLACGVYYPARRAAIWALPTAFDGNDLFIVWRPGTATTPSSWAFISHTILPTIGTNRYVVQEDADGYNIITPVQVFDVETAGYLDPWEPLLGTDPLGYVEIVEKQAPGGAYLDNLGDYLGFQDLVGAPIFAKAMFMGKVGSLVRPIVMTTHGALVEIDDPRNATLSTVFDSRNVPFQVITRPETFGLPTRRKRARYVRVSGQMLSEELDTANGAVTDENEPVVHVRIITDRNEKTDHEVTWNQSASPIMKTFKVSGRGVVHQVDVRTKKRFRLTGVALGAEVLEEEP